ncbi:S26 family signal peptidase [uncultured Friedmanniella sp.]|uniref:S26 family signal peptidase n=1 Tax=uncultured Friedmanniella sp. TaxID=335381 RepID=UPI0035C990FB
MASTVISRGLSRRSSPARRSGTRVRVRAADRGRTAAAVAVLAVFGLLAVVGVGWRLAGGSWAVIETPSMGRAAPVGTLVLIRERPIGQVRVGDVITFRPPGNPSHLYTHRVVQVYPDGSVQVRGDINGSPDPLPITGPDLLGTVVVRLRGVGYLVRGLPAVVLAVVVLLVATSRYLSVRWRSSARILGVCLIVAAAALILRPFVHPILIAVSPEAQPDGHHLASLVSGGIFPTRVTGADGAYVDLRAGETGVVAVAVDRPGGPFVINGSPHLQDWWLLAVVLVSALPLVWCLVVGLSPEEPEPEQ